MKNVQISNIINMTISILILVYMNKNPINTEKPKQLILSFNNKKL